MDKYLYDALLIACCGYALLRGGPPERIGAIILFGGSVATLFVIGIPDLRFRGLEVGALIVDVIALILIYLLAISADRYWAMWLTSMQLIAVVSHFAVWLVHRVVPWAYAVAISLWGFPMLVMLAIGVRRHRRRLELYSIDPSWSAWIRCT